VRIVSLLPSATEIVFALGLGDHLVGVTFECDHPAEARTGRHIVVGGLDTHGLSPAAIDELVRAKVAAGDDLYVLDEALFAQCAPDVVLTQDLCRVCALPSGEVDAALEHLGCTADVVTLDPHTLDDVLATIPAVAGACGVPQRGDELLAGLQDRLDAVAAAVAARAAEPPRVLVIEWVEPPFLAGHWVPDLVVRAGGVPVLARPGGRSVAATWPELVEAARDVDLVLVAPCGFGVDAAVEQAATVAERLGCSAPVWAIDANALVVRPGPRLVDGVETIAAILHGIAPVDAHRARQVAADATP
jgi:iron complex transport system substrate-binding protein